MRTPAPGIGARWNRLRYAGATPGAIVGGVAASIPGRLRLTGDVDVLVLLEREGWSSFLAAGQAFGFIPRIDDALFDASPA